jgi:hypothetical protein
MRVTGSPTGRGMSALAQYRAVQRELRALFDPFTAVHCPTCLTPCCRQPTAVMPLDVILAEELGYCLPNGTRSGAEWVSLTLVSQTSPPSDTPCEYLVGSSCAFPGDLRPFGCTRYICPPMERHMPPEWLAEARRLVERLEEAHAAMLDELRRPARSARRRG